MDPSWAAIGHIVASETDAKAMKALTVPWILHLRTVQNKIALQAELEKIELIQSLEPRLNASAVLRETGVLANRRKARQYLMTLIRCGHVSSYVINWLAASDEMVAKRVSEYFADKPTVPPELVRSLTEDIQLFCGVEIFYLDIDSGWDEVLSQPEAVPRSTNPLMKNGAAKTAYPELREFVTARKNVWSRGVIIDNSLEMMPTGLAFGYPEEQVAGY